MTTGELRLLGEPRASSEGVERALGRKDAALLAYLTLAGPVSRSKAAGLLWPEAGEAAARANLRQLLRRLKDRHGAGMVVPDDPLRLAEEVRVDVAELKVAAFQGRRELAMAGGGTLLEPFDYDDCPVFEDWLLAEREELEGLARAALADAIADHERAGAVAEALRLAEALVRRDPISETAHVTLMRLHLAAGERGAALAAYERLADTLERELGLGPAAETSALADAIRRGEASAPVQLETRGPGPAIPTSLLRPPRLIGREDSLAELTASLDAGATALLTGPAGVGKSRLAEEALRGTTLRCEGLAHDADVPFATLDRGISRFLRRFPELVPDDEALTDLATALPGLRTVVSAAPAAQHAADRGRFAAALASLLAAIMRHGVSLFADDLHAFDAASFEAVVAAAEHLREARDGTLRWRAVASLRPGELPAGRRAALERAVAAGTARWVTLRPLTRAGVTDLLVSLKLPELPPERAAALGARLHRHTGGNALFIVECVKDLLAAGDPGGADGRLPMPQRVGQIIRQRVGRLPAAAQRVALAAAVVGGEFDLTVLAVMVDAHPLDLEGEVRTLEEAQVIHQGAFTHDLIGEALMEAAPEPVRRYLEERAAQALARVGAEPGRVARHWLSAGRPGRALPYLLRAARSAQARLAYQEAADALYAASRILADAGREAEAFDRLTEAYELVIHGGSGPEATRILDALDGLAHTRAQLARAAHARASLLATGGHGSRAEAAARRGLEAARAAAEPELEALLTNDLATALFAQEAFEEAEGVFAAGAEAARARGDERGLAEALANRAVALTRLDRHEQAIALQSEAEEVLQRVGDASGRIAVLTNLGVSLCEAGRVAEALATHERVAELLIRLPEVGYAQLVHWANAGMCERELDRLGRALELLGRAAEVAATLDYWGAGAIDRHLAELFRRLGDAEAALRHARLALEQAAGRHEQELCGRLQLAAVLRDDDAARPDTEAELQRAERLLAGARPAYRVWYHLLRADTLAAKRPDRAAAVRHAREGLGIAERLRLHGHRIGAHACLSRLLLLAGAAEPALAQAQAATALMSRYTPRYGTTGEVLLARAAALAAVDGADADGAFEACEAWLGRVAREHVPADRREAFLRHDPVHRALHAA